jgi:hypothetical protein
MDLNALMEMDHVIQVHADGAVTEPRDVRGPDDVYVDTDGDGQISAADDKDLITRMREQGWELMNGYSGQHGYSGPIMHASEYVGGRLERDILAEPGYYVVASVETLDDSEEPAGWIIARKDA